MVDMLSAQEIIQVSQEDAKREKDRKAKARQRAREKLTKAQTADPKVVAKLEYLDATEKYFHASECRNRVKTYNWYLEFSAGKKILGEVRSYEEWLVLRDRYRKDLFSLAKDLLGFRNLEPHVHQPVCDIFVKKNFDGVYFEGYSFDDVKEAFWRHRKANAKFMLLLDPRGFFKTSIDTADIIQWLLNAPEARILLLTAEHKRANDLLKAVKKHFFKASEELTNFQLIYPEYMITGIDGTSKEPLIVPVRDESISSDHSLWVKSQSSQKTGSHADVIKRDDIVTPENARTPELREKARESADDTANLIDGHGFVETVGTRYAGGKEPDYYGTMLQRAREQGEDLRYFIRACWVVRPEFSGKKLRELTEEMVVLTFPELERSNEASFKALRKKLLDNETMFRNQQLNEPIDDEETSMFAVTFTLDLLRANSHNADGTPRNANGTIMAGDLAATSGGQSDFSALVVGKTWPVPKIRDSDPQLFGLTVYEVRFGKWNQTVTATQLVDLNIKYSFTQPIYIEKAAGAEALSEKFQYESMRRGGKRLNIRYVTPSNVKDAKANRIKGLEILLNEGRLKFVNGPWMDEMYSQFERFTSEKGNRGRKDDIIDAISYLVKMLPISSQPSFNAEVYKAELEIQQSEEAKMLQYQRIFGQSSAPKPQGIVASPVYREPTKSEVYRDAINKVMGQRKKAR